VTGFLQTTVLFGVFLVGGNGLALASEDPKRLPESDCTQTVVGRVQAWADRIPGFEARFEQVNRPVAFGGGAPPEAVRSSGRVWLAKPGRMRWDYEAPRKSQVIANGRELWIYDPSAREVQHLEPTQSFLDGAALQFLVGEGRLVESFDLSVRECRLDEVEIELVPREDASYERLGLRVRFTTGEVVSTTLIDLLGNRTEVRFLDARSDRAPANSHFRFDVPADAEVIELGSPRSRKVNP